MATRETLRNIDKTIQKNTLQQNKTTAQKETIRNIRNDIKYFLLDEFKQEMRTNTSAYYIILQGFEKKQEIKKQVLNSFEVNGKIKHKKEITTYFDDNYITLLNKAKKEIQAEELAELYTQQEAETNEAETNEEETINKISAILKIILIILFLPIIFIGCLFYGVMKNCK